MKRIILALTCLLFSNTEQITGSSYNTYQLDTLANGGTAFGNHVPSSATGYTTSDFLTSSALHANASAIQPDNRIVVVGYQAGSPNTALIARYLIEGTLDTRFNSGLGYQTQIGTTSTFSTNNNVVLTDVCVQPDGNIVVVGYAIPISGSPVQSILVARFTPAGVADTTFYSGAGYLTLNLGMYLTGNASGTPTTTSVDIANAVMLDASGNIIVSGSTTITQGVDGGTTTEDIFVVRFNSVGALDTSFNSGAIVSGPNSATVVTAAGVALISVASSFDLAGYGMGIDAAGNIVVVGSWNPGTTSMLVARFLTTGVLDTTNFNSGGMNPGLLVVNASGFSSPVTGYAVAFQSQNENNRIIVAGSTLDEAVAVGITDEGVLDTTEFGSVISLGSTRGYFANAWGGSTPVAYGVEIQSDDSIVLAGSSNSSGGTSSFVLNAIVANGSAGIDFVSTSISAPSFGAGLSMQQNGSFVLVGTVGTGDTQIGIARYLGVPVAGSMNYYYNFNHSTSGNGTQNPGYSTTPSITIDAGGNNGEPSIVALYPLLNGLTYYVCAATKNYGNAESQIGFLYANGVSVSSITTDPTFININDNNGAYYYPGVHDVIADNSNNAIVVGTTAGVDGNPNIYGWIARYYINDTDTVALDTSFNSDIVSSFSAGFYLDHTASTFVRVCQQLNADYIVIGQAHSPTTTAILHSFTLEGLPGTITASIASAVFCDLIIDIHNNMYVAYQNNSELEGVIGEGDICIIKYLANGSVDTSFGDDGILDTDWTVVDNSAPCLTFDNAGNVVVGISDSSGGIAIQSFASDTGDDILSGYISQSTSFLSNPVLTKVQCDTDGEFGRLILTGYDDSSFFVARMLASEGYVLDISFAPYAACTGMLTTKFNDDNPTDLTDLTPPYRISNTVCIDTAGVILFSGCEFIANNSESIPVNENAISLIGGVINSVGGGTVATQVNRFPLPGQDGTLVNGTPFDLGTSADLSGQPQAVYTFGSGTFDGYTLVVTTDGTTATLSMLDATTYALNTSSGATSFGSGENAGFVTLDNLVNAISILVDVAGNIYVLGMDNSDTPAVVICQLSSDGLLQQVMYPIIGLGDGEIPVYALSAAYDIVQQASGRILIAGYSEPLLGGPSVGVIVAINPNAELIDEAFIMVDASFAPNSPVPGCFIPTMFVEQSTPPVISIAVGETDNSFYDADKIYCVFAVIEGSGEDENSYAAVVRILENGTQFDPSFDASGDSFDAFINSLIDPTQIRLQINAADSEGYVNVVANTATGIQAVRYARSNGAVNTAPFVVIPSSLTPTLQEMLCLSDGTTLILSSNENTLDLARLTSGFAADSNFNSGGAVTGVLTTTVPASSPTQAQFWAMDVLGNGGEGIIVASDTNTTASEAVPYFTQVVNSTAVTKYPQTASATPTPGIVDGTFNADGTFPGVLNLYLELSNSSGEDDTNFPAAAVAQVLLQVEGGWYYIAGSDGTNSYIAFMSDDDVLQDQDDESSYEFGDAGMLTISNYYGVSSMLAAQNLTSEGDSIIIVAGTGIGTGEDSSTTGWLVGFDGYNGDVLFSTTTVLDSHLAIAQQSNGRILIAGDQNGVGAIVAYNSVTGAIDETFADNGMYTLTGYGPINSILVDVDDNIYVIANHTSEQSIVLSIKSSGTGTINWTSGNVTVGSTFAANNHIAFNQAGNIVAVAVNTAGNIINVNSYTLTGTIVTSLTLAHAAGGGAIATGLTTPHVTSVSVDLNTSPGKIILTGFDSSTSPTTPFVLRTTAAETGLDSSFTSGSGTAGVVTTNAFGGDTMINWNDAMINGNGKITVAGYAYTGDENNPYLARFYGDEFIGQYEQPVVAGTPGTLNYNFPDDDPSSMTAGFLTLDVLTLEGAQPVAVLPLADGSQYVGFSDGTIVRYTNANILDPSFGPATPGYAAAALSGMNAMILDGNGCLVVVGTDEGQGWIVRYASGNSGVFDTTFNDGEVLAIPHCQAANAVIEQSLARLVVVGQLSIHDDDGALFGLTNTGAADSTFSIYSESGIGVADSGIPLQLYACVADQYDRLLIAGVDSGLEGQSGAVGIARLTSSAEYDQSFGTDLDAPGIIFNVLPDAVDLENLSQVHIALDVNNNIVVAANTDGGIEVVAYANTTGSDNTIHYFTFGIGEDALLSSPTLTGMLTTADGKVLLCGNQPDGLQMWVARLYNNAGTYALDSTFALNGLTLGIMLFNIGQDVCDLAPIAIYGTGEITMVGYDTSGEVPTPFMSRAYNNPYCPAEPICLDSLPQGTVDPTFGVTTRVVNGITFWAYEDESGNQSAQAISLYDDDTIVVALDGTRDSSGSQIYINLFDVDGLLDTDGYSDETYYQEVVLEQFDNQYVNDMVVFTTIDDVTKAIIAGYAQNSTPNLTGSLLVQYNIDYAELDATFGGFNGNADGVAFGDALAFNTVGLQSNGRVIVGGSDYNGLGVIFGYTTAGNLDQSFAQGGAYAQGNQGGIFASTIDSQDRIVIAYNNGSNLLAIARILEDGSDLDALFNDGSIVTTTIPLQTSVDNNVAVALDGSGNIIVAGVDSEDDVADIYLAKYSSSGVIVGSRATISSMSLSAGFVITQLLVDQSGAVVVVGYDNNGENDLVVVARFVAVDDVYILDSTFNDEIGFVKYAVDNSDVQTTVRALIHPDGRIIITGSQIND